MAALASRAGDRLRRLLASCQPAFTMVESGGLSIALLALNARAGVGLSLLALEERCPQALALLHDLSALLDRLALLCAMEL